MEAGEARLAYSAADSPRGGKDEQIGERISTEAIRTVKTCGSFTGSEENRQGGLRRFGVHTNAAHHVVAGGPTSMGPL